MKKLLITIISIIAALAVAGVVTVICLKPSSAETVCTHTETEQIASVSPTCTKEGLTVGVRCLTCGVVLKEQAVIPALGHSEKITPGTSATCTENGLTDGVSCTRCGVVLKEQAVIPALGHNEKVTPGTSATCTESGLTDGISCTRCGEVLKEQTVIPALGHNEKVTSGTSATCTESGLTDGVSCTRCGEVLKEQAVIPALGHNEKVTPGTSATCTETGLTDGISCTRCGEVLQEQENIPALNHFEVTISEELLPTCTDAGHTAEIHCARCGDVLAQSEEVAALGHNAEVISGKAATCTETGLTNGSICSRCGTVLIEQTLIPADGHKFADWTVLHETPCELEEERVCQTCEKAEQRNTQLKYHEQRREVITVNGEQCLGAAISYVCRYCGKPLITVDSDGNITSCESALEELTIIKGYSINLENYKGTFKGISDYAFFGKNLRRVYINEPLDYVGSLAFGNCAEDLVITVAAGVDTSNWAEDWYYGNGDMETPFTVIYQTN